MQFSATTNGIEVRAEPAYSEERSSPDEGGYFWTYTITITNQRDSAAQLLTRHWDIIDANGVNETVDGPGVVGEQPILQPGEAFRYTSGCPLRSPSGMMRGSYRMQDANGTQFDVDIPAFSLDSPFSHRTVN